MPWYSAIGLFKQKLKNQNAIPQFEERVVIVRAKSAKIAERKILAEFAVHEKEFGVKFLKEYFFDDMILAPGSKVVEVAYLRRVSDLNPDKYKKIFWESKPVSCTKAGWKHSWHNRDGKTSSCYNCHTVGKGQLWRKK